MKKLSFSNAFMMRGIRLKMVLFLLVNFAAAIMHAQIYTIKVTPQEIDQLLDFKEPIQIPTVELDGLSELEIAKLKAEDNANEQLGKPPRVAVPISAHITTQENGVWTTAHGKKLWLLEVKVKNAAQLAPLFSYLNLAEDAAIWLFTGNKEMAMGPITSKNIPQKLVKVTPDFLPSESITIAYFADDESPITIQGFNMGYLPSW